MGLAETAALGHPLREHPIDVSDLWALAAVFVVGGVGVSVYELAIGNGELGMLALQYQDAVSDGRGDVLGAEQRLRAALKRSR